MQDANSLAAPMMERSYTQQDPYTPAYEEEEKMDKPKYLTTIGLLLYLATFTRPDISFAVNVLAKHSQKSTAMHWTGIKHLFRYLRGTKDLGLLYTKQGKATLKGYTNVGYKFDTNIGKSQSGYIFLKAGAPISWKSMKQTVTATSTNHLELLAFHEATQELVWLQKVHRIIS